MILLYEGASIIIMLFMYIYAVIGLVGLVILIVGLVYGYTKSKFNNKISRIGLWVIVSPLLIGAGFLLLFVCTDFLIKHFL